MHRGLIVAILALTAGGATAAAHARPDVQRANCAGTSVALTPLTDLRGTYHGFRGGLYPGGRDAPSPKYQRQGLTAARRVVPLDPQGNPSPSGRMVLLSIGMSNATMEFSAFKTLADRDPRKSPSVAVVDGAEGGQDAERIESAGSPYWSFVDARLAQAGVTGAQVEAVWLKEAIAGPTEVFPADARRLEADLAAIVGVLASRFPSLRLVYLSSRTYAGYATTRLNPEPYAYQSGFAVRWTIGRRIDGRLRGPWVGWGPYLWTNGEHGRRDGLVWTCADTAADGTHPSASGRQKVAQLLLDFFAGSATARPWFTRSS